MGGAASPAEWQRNKVQLSCYYWQRTARGKNHSVFWSPNLISISVVPPQDVRRRRQSFVSAYLCHLGQPIPPLSVTLLLFPSRVLSLLSLFSVHCSHLSLFDLNTVGRCEVFVVLHFFRVLTGWRRRQRGPSMSLQAGGDVRGVQACLYRQEGT